MIQKFLPTSPLHSTMAYEVYRRNGSSEADFHLIADMYERVMREDKVLCTNAQKNLERGVFVNGLLHPKYEKAPLFFQRTVREVVTEHYEKEKQAGKEIWPARHRVVGAGEKGSERDEEICAGIKACKDGRVDEAMEW
jgi:hypothetical protein